MYYKLTKGLKLRGWDLLPWAAVFNGRTRFIDKDLFTLLTMCDGRIDMDIPLVSEKYRQMIPGLVEEGAILPCEKGDGIDPDQAYRLYPSRYIETAHWSVTGKCNYRCKHCYMSAPCAKLGELSHEKIMYIINELERCGIMNVTLTGGEPLVRRDFMEIVDELLKRDIRIETIYSNGRLVTPKLLDELESRGIRPEFNMSYDGEGWHDWLRGIPGAEADVERAFRLCHDRGFPTGAELCIHQYNKDVLRKSMNNLRDWGCETCKTNPVSDVGAWKDNGHSNMTVSLDELYRIYLDYIPEYYADGMPVAIQMGGFFAADPRHPDRYDIPSEKVCHHPEKATICGHARHTMYISPEGRCLPCMALSGMDVQGQFPLIFDRGLAYCLTESRYMEFINSRVSDFYALNPECAACPHREKCAGGCRASALEFYPGNLMAPDRASCKLFTDGWDDKIRAVADPIVAKYPSKE